jgi:hypothetical protein
LISWFHFILICQLNVRIWGLFRFLSMTFAVYQMRYVNCRSMTCFVFILFYYPFLALNLYFYSVTVNLTD